ncbi:MAG: hypothetical protein HY934_07430 [Candidatus Firestonebacteria bacterium]|nr:hypothetical protein [Candidatus Firestonebacteria bacterium]
MKKIFCGLLFIVICLTASYVLAKEIPKELYEIYKISPGLVHISQNAVSGLGLKDKEKIDYIRCGTPDFKTLFTNLNKLSPKAKAYAKKMFRRPTDYQDNPEDFQFDKMEVVYTYEMKKDAHFRIHYSRDGRNKVPVIDSNSDSIPDYVESCAGIFESVWIKEVNSLGYTEPISDNNLGGNSKYDIYVLNLNIDNVRALFGYTNVDSTSTKEAVASSFIVVDNDYPKSLYKIEDPLNALRITAAHEFFHAIQFAYDVYEEVWWDEASAVWMEEEMYRDVNGYFVFLPDFFKYPWIALNRSYEIINPAPQHHYAVGVFPIFLANYYNVNIIKSIWEKCKGIEVNKRVQGMDAIKKALDSYLYNNAKLEDAFSEFTIYNYFTGKNFNPSIHSGKYYPDGKDYPEISSTYIHKNYISYDSAKDNNPLKEEKPYQWGSNYVMFRSENLDSNLKVSFQGLGGVNTTWRFNVIKIDNNGIESIEKITDSGGEVIVNHFGSSYKKVVLIPSLVYTLDTSSYNYSYRVGYVDDTTAPQKVTGLKAVSNGDSNVILTWRNPGNNDTINQENNDFKGIRIIRSFTKEPASPFEGEILFTGIDSSYIDILANGLTAYYGICSFDEMKNMSSPVTISVNMLDTTAPQKITALAAEDDESSGKVNLSWKGYISSPDIIHYNIYVNTSYFDDISGLSIFDTASRWDSTYQVKQLNNGIPYYFAVTAVDEAGNENKKVETKSTSPTLDIRPPSPVQLDVEMSEIPGSLKLDWNAYDEKKEKDVTYYRIYKSDKIFTNVSYDFLLDSTKAGVKFYVFDKVQEGEINYYAVTAIDEMYNEDKNVSVKSWGYNKFTVQSPVYDEIKIYKNGNYAYKGQYIGNVKSKGNADLYLFPKKNFITFMSSGYFNSYMLIDPSMKDKIVNFSIKQYRENKFLQRKVIISTGAKSASPFIVDWNNDGKKDLLVGDENGLLYIYINTGTDASPLFAGSEFVKINNKDNLRVDGKAIPFVIDWDNDEKKDLLVGSADGKVYFYQNIGVDESPVFKDPETLKDADGKEIDVGDNSAPFIVDWNHDEKKDLILGSKNNEVYAYIYIYINQGYDYSPSLVNSKTISLYVGGDLLVDIVPFVTDWEKKGKNDLVIGDDNGNLYDFRDKGDNKFSPYAFMEASGSRINAGESAHPFIIDWDNDYYMDIIAGNRNGEILIFKGVQGEAFKPKLPGKSKVGPCIISNMFNNSSIFLEKLIYLKDKYLLNNISGKYLVKKYYEYN